LFHGLIQLMTYFDFTDHSQHKILEISEDRNNHIFLYSFCTEFVRGIGKRGGGGVVMEKVL